MTIRELIMEVMNTGLDIDTAVVTFDQHGVLVDITSVTADGNTTVVLK